MIDDDIVVTDDDLKKLSKAVRLVFGTALKIIEQDPHQFSARSCASCRTVSELIGRPFGCEKRRSVKH